MLRHSRPASSNQWMRSALWHFLGIVKGKFWDSNELVVQFRSARSGMFGSRHYWEEADDQTTVHVSRRPVAPAGSDGSPRDMPEETALYEDNSGCSKSLYIPDRPRNLRVWPSRWQMSM